jgi:hypothetical protein
LVQAEVPLGASSVAKGPSNSSSASSASESASQQVWQPKGDKKGVCLGSRAEQARRQDLSEYISNKVKK